MDSILRRALDDLSGARPHSFDRTSSSYIQLLPLHLRLFFSKHATKFVGDESVRMEAFLLASIPVLIAIVAIGITALVIGVQVARFKRRRHLLQLEAKGCSKWQLLIDVKPEDGSPPYQATLVISFTNPEKAHRAARVGAEVPLRYDPMDRQTFAIDSIAMGYGDPYEAVRKMMLPTG